jgi:hypothetical protein
MVQYFPGSLLNQGKGQPHSDFPCLVHGAGQTFPEYPLAIKIGYQSLQLQRGILYPAYAAYRNLAPALQNRQESTFRCYLCTGHRVLEMFYKFQ